MPDCVVTKESADCFLFDDSTRQIGRGPLDYKNPLSGRHTEVADWREGVDSGKMVGSDSGLASEWISVALR